MLDAHYLNKGTELHGRYVVEDILGEGGFGITYIGRDTLFDTPVAIKEFYPNGIVLRNHDISNEVSISYTASPEIFESGKNRFISEAKVMAKFQKSKGIVNVNDFFEANNTAYIVMEYLAGVTLKEFLKENGPMTADDMLVIMAPLLESLDEIHKAGMIHRDISPDNIMVMANGEVRLMDFGAARDYTEFGEKSLSVILKPGYAPVEQYQTRGMQGPWTDIYALCATFYRCVTGVVPEDSLERVLDDTLKAPSELGVQLPAQIEHALMKGMSVDPSKRYQNLKEFCDDLYSELEEGTDIAPEVGAMDGTEAIALEEPDPEEMSSGDQGASAAAPVNDTSPDTEPKSEEEVISLPEDEPADQAVEVKKSVPEKAVAEGGGKKKSKLPMIAAALVLLIGIGGGAGYHSYQKSLEREVPDLTNMTLEEASKLAEGDDESLLVIDSGSEYSDDVEKGSIISQNVEAGEILKKGDQIEVVVSKGALKEVPSVAGLSQKKAEKAITDAGLVCTVSGNEWSDDVKKGSVISQGVAAGEKLEEGAEVTIVISDGVEQVEVPDLKGKTVKEAKALLKKAKLKYNADAQESEYSDSVKEDQIISQSIKAGKKVDKNKKVSVTVSKGPEPEPEPEPEPTYRSSGSSGSSSRSSGSSSSKSSGSSSKKSSGSSKKSSGSSKKKSGGSSYKSMEWVN